MKYTKAVQETLDRVCPIIDKFGAKWEFSPVRNKHPKLYIIYNGQRRMTPIACSPSRLPDTLNLKERDVKRILRELGAIS